MFVALRSFKSHVNFDGSGYRFRQETQSFSYRSASFGTACSVIAMFCSGSAAHAACTVLPVAPGAAPVITCTAPDGGGITVDYAAGVNYTGNATLNADGTTAETGTIKIVVDDAAASTATATLAAGSSINTAAGNGLDIRTIGGTISITGTSTITGNSDAISAITTGSGNVTVDVTGNITGTTNTAIKATSDGGAIMVTTNGDLNAVAAGIQAATTGSGTIVVTANGNIGNVSVPIVGIQTQTVDGDNTVTANGSVKGSSFGVSAQSSTGNVKINGDAAITGGVGVQAVTAGIGTVTVDTAGNITGTAGDGVTATANGSGTVTVNAASGFTILGAADGASATSAGGLVSVGGDGKYSGVSAGIEALNTSGAGGGGVTVSGAGTTVATVGTGIIASISNVANGADISVTRSGLVTGGAGGISATTLGTGNVSVTGVTASGTSGPGILASSTTGDVTISGTGNSTGATGVVGTSTGGNVDITVAAKGTTGVDASTTGAGKVDVKSAGNITGTAGNGVTTSAVNGDTTITASAGDTISGSVAGATAKSSGTGSIQAGGAGNYAGGTGPGISAIASGTAGSVTVTGSGSTSSTAGTGILASIGNALNADAVLVDRSGSITGVNGIDAATAGMGTVTVTTGGAVTATAGTGITATGAGGAVDVTVGNTIDATATGIAATNTSIGPITVTSNGVIGGTTSPVTGISTLSQSGTVALNINEGIKATATGISSTSTDGSITTTIAAGKAVTAGVGIDQSTTTGAITVTNSGQVIGTATGVKLASTGTAPAGALNVDNKSGATISGAGTQGVALTAVDANEVVKNAGTISGLIGVVANVTGKGNIDVSQSAGALNGATTAVKATTVGDGTVDVKLTGGTVAPTTGATVETSAKGGNTVIQNDVALESTAGAGILASSTSGGITTTTNANVTGATYGLNLNSTSGPIASTIATGVTVEGTTAAINGASSGKFDITNAGEIKGLVTVAGGAASIFDNAASGVWNTDIGAGASQYVGTLKNSGKVNVAPDGTIAITGDVENSNLIKYLPGGTGNTSINVTGSTNNTGIIDMQNGVTGDKYNSATYTGTGGTVKVDINFSGAGTADTLNTTDAKGSTAVSFAITGGLLNPNAIKIVTQSADSDPSETFTGGIASNGLVSYQFVKEGKDWVVKSSFNVSGLAGISSGLASITNGFYQPASSLVSAKPNAMVDELQCGTWARGEGSKLTSTSTTSLAIGGQTFQTTTSESKANFTGFQGGLDCAILRAGGTAWNIHAGLTGGQIQGDVSQPGFGFDFEDPFIGAYAFFTNGEITLDLSARRDFYKLELSGAGLASKLPVDGQSYSVAAYLGYQAAIATNLYVTPAVALSYTRTSIDDFSANTGLVTVSVGSDEALVGRVGVQLKYVQAISETTYLVPFAGFSHWENFTSQTDALFAVHDKTTFLVDSKSNNAKSFQQYEAGLSIADPQAGLSGFVKGTLREGDDIRSSTITGGGRWNF